MDETNDDGRLALSFEAILSDGLLRTLAAAQEREERAVTAEEIAVELGLPLAQARFIEEPLRRELASGRVVEDAGMYELSASGLSALGSAGASARCALRIDLIPDINRR